MTQVRSTSFEISELEIVAITQIDAPRALVWAANTEPEHLKQWMNVPAGWKMVVAEMDVRPGGAWQWVWEGQAGETLEMHGEYREVLPPSKLVNTERWGDPYAETLNTLTLTQEDGGTTLRSAVHYPSAADRERAMETGMLDGWAEGYERLAEYLRSLA